MPIDKDELDEIEDRISTRLQAILTAQDHAAHPEDYNKDGSRKLHTRTVRKRVMWLVVIVTTMAGVDHLVHLEWVIRISEVSVAAFFHWWIETASHAKVVAEDEGNNLVKKIFRRK